MFSLPAELREMVYREALLSPHSSPLRTFAPPALLHANKRLRNEALPIFYGENNFEITVKKRSPEDEALAARRRLPSVEMFVWPRFLRMWDVFNCFGSNSLRHVRRVTLICQLSMGEWQTFGYNKLNKRLGFRFSGVPFEEDTDPAGVLELNRGTLNLRSFHEAYLFLSDKTCEYGNVYYKIKGSLEGRQAPAPPRTETLTLPDVVCFW